jgi:hypothetical protein
MSLSLIVTVLHVLNMDWDARLREQRLSSLVLSVALRYTTSRIILLRLLQKQYTRFKTLLFKKNRVRYRKIHTRGATSQVWNNMLSLSMLHLQQLEFNKQPGNTHKESRSKQIWSVYIYCIYWEFLEWRTRASPALIGTCWRKLAVHYAGYGLAHSLSASLTTQSLFLFIFLRLSRHVQLIFQVQFALCFWSRKIIHKSVSCSHFQ